MYGDTALPLLSAEYYETREAANRQVGEALYNEVNHGEEVFWCPELMGRPNAASARGKLVSPDPPHPINVYY